MFHINKEKELTIELLQKIIRKFNQNVKPNIMNQIDYYNGIQNILKKTYSDESKPCNKVVTNFCKNIADAYCGYLASAGCISYTSENDIEEIMNILRYNDYENEDSKLLLDALVCGFGAELMYIDSESKTRFRTIEPSTCFGIFDDTLSNDLLYFVRIYLKDEWNDTAEYYVDVYSDYSIKHYEMNGMLGSLKFIDEENHYFSQVPANILVLPEEKGVFECVMGNQDLYNNVMNANMDDYDAFVDAYLQLVGVDADADDISAMKENRVLVLPEGASATWLTKTDTSTGVESKLQRIQSDIYRIASCPDFSSESFTGGVSSGIAIRYKLCGMENRAAAIATILKKALQRRIEIICGIATLRYGEEVFRDIQISMKRNVPVDNNEVITIINSLRGIVSDATLLSQVPFVDDVNQELELLKKQNSLYLFSGDEE